MLQNYLIIHKSILPDYYEKVLVAKRLLETGKVKEISEAARQAGISRSTFYKYKDYVIEPSELTIGRKAVLSMMLSHERGMLSNVLNMLSRYQLNILTITQSLPIHGIASVVLSVDMTNISMTTEAIVTQLLTLKGVRSAKLVAIE